MKGSPVKLTNFYPYYIDTGLFEGFKPTMRWILPTLQADKVTRRMFQAIMQEEKEVFIEPIIWWIKLLLQLVPLSLRNKALNLLVGEGMEHFVGRAQQVYNSAASDKSPSLSSNPTATKATSNN